QLETQLVRRLVERHLVVLEVRLHPGEGLVGFLVVAEGHGRLAERLRLAEPIADIAQVAQGAGQVAVEDVGVQLFSLATPYRLDEVAIVQLIAAAAEAFDLLAVIGEGDAAEVVRADQNAVFAVEDVADAHSLQQIGPETTDLEDQLDVAVVEDADLRVG